MRFKLGCKLSYQANAEMAPLVFNIEAARTAGQVIEEERLTIMPDGIEPDRWIVPESGNRYFRVNAPAGPLSLEYQARVRVARILDDPDAVTEMPPARLPLAVFNHLWPSRYCQSDRLDRFARSTFGALDPGYARVNGVCNWINQYVAYEGGVSDAMTSAFDTVTQRAGVCRDFAHLGIALCRAMGIPARYVSGYAYRLYPPDFHAVFEAYLQGPQGGGWYLFDPTRKADPAGIVRIGVGRDAAEVAFCSPFGPVGFSPPQVWIEAMDDAGDSLATVETTTQAVRVDEGAVSPEQGRM